MTEVSRCPFCGGQAMVSSFTYKTGGIGWAVKCYNCSSQGKPCASGDEAIVAWNKRVSAEEKKEDWVVSVLNIPLCNVIHSENILEKLKKHDITLVWHLTHYIKKTEAFKEFGINRDQFTVIKARLCDLFPKQSYPQSITKDAGCWGWWWL